MTVLGGTVLLLLTRCDLRHLVQVSHIGHNADTCFILRRVPPKDCTPCSPLRPYTHPGLHAGVPLGAATASCYKLLGLGCWLAAYLGIDAKAVRLVYSGLTAYFGSAYSCTVEALVSSQRHTSAPGVYGYITDANIAFARPLVSHQVDSLNQSRVCHS